METNVITITRQFGSLGRPIAKRVAERLGFAYYDRFIIDRIAGETNQSVADLLDYDSKGPLTVYDKMTYPLGLGLVASQKKLFAIEREIILDLIQKENCVIVGRCSDYILTTAKAPNLLRLFLYAPYSARYNFCMSELGLTAEAVESYIAEVDEARDRFYRSITGEQYTSIKYRDLLIDTSSLEMEKMIDSICFFAQQRFGLINRDCGE